MNENILDILNVEKAYTDAGKFHTDDVDYLVKTNIIVTLIGALATEKNARSKYQIWFHNI